MNISHNQITGANAGGPRQLPTRTRWAARVGQFDEVARMALTKTKTRLSTVAGLAALGFLGALFLTSLATPDVWFFIIYGGILVSLVTAVWFWRVERRHDRQASSLGLWIAIAVVILFILLCIVLPGLG